MSDTPKMVSIQPHPDLQRAALAHCQIEGLILHDDGTGDITDESKLGSSCLTLAMVKHVEDTMILPSNVDRLRRARSDLGDLLEYGALDDDDREIIEDIRFAISEVADNLDSRKR